MSAGRSAQTLEKWSFFSAFSRLGLFPQVFGKVKEWLKLFGMKEGGWLEGGVLVFKDIKIDHFWFF